MFVLDKTDKITQLPDRCSFGVGFEANSKSAIPERFKVRVGNSIEKFEHYEENNLIYHFVNDINLMKLTRKKMISKKIVKRSELECYSSTNGEDNFIPLLIKRRHASKIDEVFQEHVLPAVIDHLKERQNIALWHLEQSGIEFEYLVPLDYFKLTSTEICLDIGVDPGFSFDRDNEFERRMANYALYGHKGQYTGVANQILPLSTFKGQKDDGVACNITKLNDGSTLHSYIKEKCSASPRTLRNHQWLLRLERKCTFKQFKTVHPNADTKVNLTDIVPVRKFKTAKALYLIFEKLRKHHYEQLEPLLTLPFPGNCNQTIEAISDIIESYAPFRSRTLIKELTTGLGRLPVKAAHSQYVKTQIYELARKKIIIKPGGLRGKFYVLNWSKFTSLMPQNSKGDK